MSSSCKVTRLSLGKRASNSGRTLDWHVHIDSVDHATGAEVVGTGGYRRVIAHGRQRRHDDQSIVTVTHLEKHSRKAVECHGFNCNFRSFEFFSPA